MSTQVEILTSRDTEDNQTPHLVDWAGEIYKKPLPYPGALWLPESYYMGNTHKSGDETESSVPPVDQLKRTSELMFKLAAWGATLSIAAATLLGRPETTSASGLSIDHIDKAPLPTRASTTLSTGIPSTPYLLTSEDLTAQCTQAHETNSVTGPNAIPIQHTEIIFDRITFQGDTDGLASATQQSVVDDLNYVGDSFAYNMKRSMGVDVTTQILPVQTLPKSYATYIAQKNAKHDVAYSEYSVDFNYTEKDYDPKEGVVRSYVHIPMVSDSQASIQQQIVDLDGLWGGVDQIHGHGDAQILGYLTDARFVSTYAPYIMHEIVHTWGGNHLDIALQAAPKYQGKYDPYKNLMVPTGSSIITANPEFNAANVYNLCTFMNRIPAAPKQHLGM